MPVSFPSAEGSSIASPRNAAPAGWLARMLSRFRTDDAPSVPQSLLDAVPEAFLVLDADGEIVAANRAVHAALGQAPGALVGRDFAEAVLAQPFRDAHRARLRAFAESAGTTPDAPERVRVVQGDRGEREVDLAFQPTADGTRLLFGILLREASASDAAALSAAENRRRTLQTIVDVIPDPIVAVDRAGHVIVRNPASARLASTAGGDGAAPAEALSADEWRAAEAVIRSGVAVLQHEEPQPDGRVHLATRVPVCSPSGAVVGLVSIAHDVTARKAAEAQLVADKLAAEAATQANREFLATTSHEVRTLMSGVTGMTSLLLDTHLDAEQRDFVETVRTSSDALLRLINDVLDFSKIEAGMLAVEHEPYAVRQTVAEAIAIVSQQAAAKGLDLSATVDDAVAETVLGDAARVRQVLANLLSNAVKFTVTGGVRVRVEPAPGDTLVVSVADTGAGIAADRLGAIFERFEQADASTARTHGGTGLGLSISLRLVERMGGELTVDSVPGAGSVFRFTIPGAAAPAPIVFEEFGDALAPPDTSADTPADAQVAPVGEAMPEPIAEAPADDETPVEDEPMVLTDVLLTTVPLSVDAAAEASGDGLAAEPETLDLSEIAPHAALPVAPPDRATPGAVMMSDAVLPSARVLVVEDDAVLQRITSLTLKRLGYRPDIVGNGLEAVEAVRRHAYDVVLMDVMMPVMDGLTATRHIRADATLPQMPVIVALTANAMQEDRQRCLEAGCDEYLSKPVEPRHLAATIERAIREKTGQEA